MKWKKSENNSENWTREMKKILERLIISDFLGSLSCFPFRFTSMEHRIVGCAKYRMRIKKVKDSRNVFLLQTFTHTGSCALLFFSHIENIDSVCNSSSLCIYGHRFHFSFILFYFLKDENENFMLVLLPTHNFFISYIAFLW